MRPHGTQEQLERRRRQAIALLQDGMSLSAISKKLKCSPSSVHLWREIHRKKGENGLNPKPIPGRPSHLDASQKRALARILVKGPLSSGYVTDLWTTRRVAEVVRKQLKVSYHPNHLWRLLRGLGWSCQKPETRARERDEVAIERWKKYRWPHIKKGQKAWGPSDVSG